MRRAIVWYNRADEMEACVRCHRRMREIVPKNLSPRRLLDIWRPAGVVIAYPHIGAADEAASQLRTLGRAVIEWPIWERFQYHLALSNIYRELKEWDKVVQEGRQFATWARAIPENDPALLYKNVSFDGEVSDELTSELGRWFCICEMLALVIIKSEVQAGIDSLRTFSDLEQSLGKFEQHQLEAERRAYDNPNDPSFRTTADQFNSRLGGCFGLAGWAAYEAGKCEEALQYLSREEELTGSLRASGPFYRTAALLALDRIEEAKECLSKISGKCTTNGDARRYIEQIKEFEKVREDPDFIKITQEWR